MSERSGAQISRKSFIQSLMILYLLMMLAGVLTRVMPAGACDHPFYFDRRQFFCYPGPQRCIKEQHPGYCLAFWRAKICFAPDYFAFAGLLDERSS